MGWQNQCHKQIDKDRNKKLFLRNKTRNQTNLRSSVKFTAKYGIKNGEYGIKH